MKHPMQKKVLKLSSMGKKMRRKRQNKFISTTVVADKGLW